VFWLSHVFVTQIIKIMEKDKINKWDKTCCHHSFRPRLSKPSAIDRRSMPYYSDLSADSSRSGNSDEESDGSSWGAVGTTDEKKKKQSNVSHNDHVILHLDIDCFYCQCEMIDRKLPESLPLAVGQKHIIVTSNYAARKLGVKKLQSRESAYKACPGLLIVEGSDLERYRKHGRKVYEAFRACIKDFFGSLEVGKSPAVSRGRGMDEMQADVTCLVDALTVVVDATNTTDSIYIYGDQKETTTLVEDQTGAEAIVQPYCDSTSRQHQHHTASTLGRADCQARLVMAAKKLGRVIQQTILDKTGFTTTLGFSINPLLAKLASDLQKPISVNVLYPWRAQQLISSMPLRKIPDAGYRTIKLLHPALERFHGTRGDNSFWTCR
jgi:DNA polymerase iota